MAPPFTHSAFLVAMSGIAVFVARIDVLFGRADGHYIHLSSQDERLFCVLPVTEALP